MKIHGNYTLCTSVNETLDEADKFPKRAFATYAPLCLITRDALCSYDVSTKKWTLLEDAVADQSEPDTSIYCGRVEMSPSVMCVALASPRFVFMLDSVFPVRCANDPESQLFRDQLVRQIIFN